jgi:hypothetical protein
MALDLGIFLEGSQSTFKVKVSENDAQAQFLLDKLTSSDGSVTITETNDGGIEQINLTASGGGDNMANADLTLDANRTHDLAGFGLKFNNGQVTIKGAGSSSSSTALYIENSSGTLLGEITDIGDVALGLGAFSRVDGGSVAIGRNANALAALSVCIGMNSTDTDVSYSGSVAVGYNTDVTGQRGVAVGRGAQSPQDAVSIGYLATSAAQDTVSIGALSDAGGSCTALGYNAQATGTWSTAIGWGTNASGTRSQAIGLRMAATATNAYIIGVGTSVRTNSTANSFEVNFNESTSSIRLANSADGFINTSGNFVFGNNTVSGSAKLSVDSTTSGFLPPRMTTTEKNAIVAPASGLMVYDTTLGKLCVYTGAAWETITSV